MMSAPPLPNEVRTVAGSGGPPYDDSMDRRLVVLETRFDVILPTLASKHDLELLRADLKADFSAGLGNGRHELTERIDKVQSELTGRIGKVQSELTERIDKVQSELTERIDKVQSELTERIDKVASELTSRIDKVASELTSRIDKEAGRIDKVANDLTTQIEKLRREMMTMMKWIIALIISMLMAFCGSTFAMINAIKAAPPSRTAAAAPLPSSTAAPASLSR